MDMSFYAMARDRQKLGSPGYFYYHELYAEKVSENANKAKRESLAYIASLKDYSPLNRYAKNSEIQKVDPQAHKFLVMRKKKFKEVTKEWAEKHHLRSCAEAHDATMTVSSLAIISLFLVAPPIACLAIPVAAVTTMASSGYRCRVNEESADEKTIQEVNKEELKGGIRFYQACQKVEQIKEKNKGLFRKLCSNVTDNRLFRETPSWNNRISKIEKKLEDYGEKFLCTEEDQEKIALLEKLI